MVTSPEWSNRMFRGHSGDFGWDFLGTFLGPIFAGWVITWKHVFVSKKLVYQKSRNKQVFSNLLKIA